MAAYAAKHSRNFRIYGSGPMRIHGEMGKPAVALGCMEGKRRLPIPLQEDPRFFIPKSSILRAFFTLVFLRDYW